jgi:CHAT domain-containing protein/tetratricopeptide (TPR) repeat protein
LVPLLYNGHCSTVSSSEAPMVDREHERSALLLRCSVLRRFDRVLLREFLLSDDSTVDALLAGPEFERLADGYRLRPAYALAAREQLHAEGRQIESDLHQRALTIHFARLKQDRPAELRNSTIDECLYHLDALFVPLSAQLQWQTMRRYALQLLRARPWQIAHRQRLLMFAGYAAMHLQKYARGERLLSSLLSSSDLEPDIQIKALKALADASWFRSRYGEALDRYEQLYQTALTGNDLIYQGLALLNRAIVFHELELYDRALADCEHSLTIFRAQNDQTREAYALYHAALFTLHLGHWDDAKQYCADAAVQFERLGMHAYLGFAYWCQGLLAHIFDDETASEAAYLQALAVAEAAAGEQLSLALDIHVNLGILAHSYGRLQKALDHYDFAQAYAIRLDRPHQACLIHFRRGRVFEQLGRPGKAFLAYRRAITVVEQIGSATALEDVKISLLGTTQQIYEAIVLRCVAFYEQSFDDRWVERALHYVERARSRAFLDALAQKMLETQNTPDEAIIPVQLSDIQSGLPNDALLIEYFTTGVLSRSEHLIASIPASNHQLRAALTLPPTTLAFAISRTACKLFAPAIDLNRLRPQSGKRHPGRHLLLGSIPTTLYEQLIAPASDMLVGKSLLYLVPHGPLHYVPFAALRTEAGTFLVDLASGDSADGLALAQAPSATILIRSYMARRSSYGSKALAVGFNEPLGFQPLRFAEAEALHIADLLGGEAWVGAQPKGEHLRVAGKELRLLHIAGHAMFTPNDPLGSWLLLGDDDQLSARQIINKIDLGVELVTMSSCTSGVSHVARGDELLGLPRALLYAGAPTVVCTRWEAIDLVALLVMDRFYKELPRHSPAVALRNAQVAVRDLTFAEIAKMFTAWCAQDGPLAAAIGDPTLLLKELSLVAREALSEVDEAVEDTLPDYLPHTSPITQPAALQYPSVRPFAAPLLWAPFMVIGRA